jgi:aldose 1-epimerase
MKIKQESQFIPNSETKLFGLMPDGESIYVCKIANKKGAILEVINYGATVSSLKIPLKNGGTVDVVLGFDSLESYIKSFDLAGAPYLGSTVGRYAGRINKGSFVLDGKTFQLNINNNNHSLHGGKLNFSKVAWTVKNIHSGENPSITLTYVSPAGEENYPGELSVELTYTFTEENELLIEYSATTTEDTIVNLTHHSYFNLNGHNSEVLSQEMVISADKILEATTENIPTGVFLDLADSSFDFSSPKKCPATIDTTFVLNKEKEEVASLYSPKNNLKMTVYTDQPVIHIYVGGNCETIEGKEKALYHSLSGICFETQNFPDAPNQDHFPSAVLKIGETYCHKTRYKFEIF